MEGLEGQVGNQVSGVPDERLVTSGDVGGGQKHAVPRAEGLLLGQVHAAQVPVDDVSPETKTHEVFNLR